jgi:hypothetical protein
MRIRSILLAGLAAVVCARATTLIQLTLGDMIRQSTGIVRARVTGSSAGLRGQEIYTFYHLQVLESPKPGENHATEIDVAVPGGTLNGMQQVVVGAPVIATGSEYVVFLWTGKSGLTQIMGLSQGLFLVSEKGSGKITLTRPAASDLMLDASGKAVGSEALGLDWNDLLGQIRARIRKEQGK